MLSGKEWALVQTYPEHKRIPSDSPLMNNTEFAYSTNSLEHALAMREFRKVPVHKDSVNLASEIKAIQEDFLTRMTTTSQVPTKIEGEDQHAVTPEKPVEIIEVENQFDLNKDTFTFYELLQMPQTEIPFQVENLIPESCITILSGDSDGGKTSLYQQLALAIIQGKTEFLGLKLKTKYHRALIINTEDSPVSIKVRLVKQLAKAQITDDEAKRLTFMTLNREVEQKVMAFLATNPVDLVVIDAYSDVFPGNTNSDIDTRSFMNNFLDIIRKFNCTVLFVHHIGKGKDAQGQNKDSLLGSAAIHGKPRSVLMLKKLKFNTKLKSLKIVKGNDVSEEVKAQEMILEFDPETLLHKVVADKTLKEEITTQLQTQVERPVRRGSNLLALKLQAVKLQKEGRTLEDIGQKLGRDKSTVSRWLKDPPAEYDLSVAV